MTKPCFEFERPLRQFLSRERWSGLGHFVLIRQATKPCFQFERPLRQFLLRACRRADLGLGVGSSERRE